VTKASISLVQLASARVKRSGNIFAAIIEAQLIIDGGHQVVVLINPQHAQIANDHREPSETTIGFLNGHYTTDRIGILITEKDASLNATETKLCKYSGYFRIAVTPVCAAALLRSGSVKIERNSV
jgi:hypothetical protein